MATKTVTITVSDLTGAEVTGEPYKVTVKGPKGDGKTLDVTEREARILMSGNASVEFKRGRKAKSQS